MTLLSATTLTIGAVLLVVAGLGGGLLLTRRKRRHPSHAAGLRQVSDRLDRALDANDGAAFCRAMREAAQNQLAPLLGTEPGSITLADFRWDRPDADLCVLFEAANAVLYSGRVPSRDEMRDWRQRLLSELERLAEADPLVDAAGSRFPHRARVIT